MIENHVTNQEISKRLKELGVPQNSLFKWHWKTDEEGNECYHEVIFFPSDIVNSYSAFLSSELGEMLPDFIGTEHLYSFQQARNWTDDKKPKHHLCYWAYGKEILHEIDNENEANARGLMLIYLIENGLLDVNNLNV